MPFLRITVATVNVHATGEKAIPFHMMAHNEARFVGRFIVGSFPLCRIEHSVFFHKHDIRLLGSGQFRELECQEFCTMCFRCRLGVLLKGFGVLWRRKSTIGIGNARCLGVWPLGAGLASRGRFRVHFVEDSLQKPSQNRPRKHPVGVSAHRYRRVDSKLCVTMWKMPVMPWVDEEHEQKEKQKASMPCAFQLQLHNSGASVQKCSKTSEQLDSSEITQARHHTAEGPEANKSSMAAQQESLQPHKGHTPHMPCAESSARSASEVSESLSLEERVNQAERVIFVQYNQIHDLSKAVKELRIELARVQNSVDRQVCHHYNLDKSFEEHRSWLKWLTSKVDWLWWHCEL